MICSGSPQSRWQTHQYVRSGLCCRKKKTREVFADCAQSTGKSFTVLPMESVHCEGVVYGGLDRSDANNPERTKYFGYQQFISPILSDADTARNSTVRLFLKIRAKMGRYQLPIFARICWV